MIGDVLRAYRKSEGVTLAQVAEACGVSISYLSDIERGQANPSFQMTQKLCEYTGISINFLFGSDYDTLSEPEWLLIHAVRSGDMRKVLRIISEHFTPETVGDNGNV